MNLHKEVKESADAGDVKDLKYIFVDSLDVDPTFEAYLDDYNYCAGKNLFEQHKELTPFTDRKADWNDSYWGKIKRDLLKNFSRERLDHMRKVALVVNAEKVARLQKERQTVEPKISQPAVTQRPVTLSQPRFEPSIKSKAQQQQEELEAAKRKLAEENAQVDRQQRQQQEQLKSQQQDNQQTGNDSLKKALGIAAGAAGIAVVVKIIYNLLK